MPHATTSTDGLCNDQTLKESKVDVLILGAGPAGVMSAHGLAMAGVKVRILDERPKKVSAGQADGIQPRTIEVLQSYGLAERLIREGNQMHMAAFYNPSPSGGIARTGRAPDVTAPTARYPFEITLHQGAIENIFLDSMRNYSLEVERPKTLVELSVDDDQSDLESGESHPVRAVVTNLPGGEAEGGEWKEGPSEIVHAKYVIGADGAHSWVRKTLNIAMEGEQTDYVWGVVDTVPVTDFPDIRNRCAIHSDNGSCMIIPREGDMVRLYVQIREGGDKKAEGRVDRSKWSAERIMELAQKSLHPYKISFPNPIEWWTIYVIGQRVASKFSVKERVFITGDACHTHSPKAGQGMNASMNDGHNLIWKLTQVLRGWAKPELLKTYEFERRKYAQDLITFDKRFAALFSGAAQSSKNENGITHAEFLSVFQTFGGFTSGIGIHYAPSTIVSLPKETDVDGASLKGVTGIERGAGSGVGGDVHRCARGLVVGQRMPPTVVVRAADYRPIELQDLLKSDMRFKLIVFCGDASGEGQKVRLQSVAEKVGGENGFLKKFTPKGMEFGTLFEIISIGTSSKENVDYTDLPSELRPHWSNVYIDDLDVHSRTGGKAYSSYGISPEGAVVVVRPDGYVGLVTSLDDVLEVESYFSGFLVQF